MILEFLYCLFIQLQDKMDLFVPLHFFGWWCKTLLLRDWWLCWVISIMFEILEYTLEHQLPNFSECWWDHVSTGFDSLIDCMIMVILIYLYPLSMLVNGVPSCMRIFVLCYAEIKPITLA